MATAVTMGAMMTCTMGVAPCSLIVIRPNVTGKMMPMANISDCAPGANIPTFGMCQSPANPAVAAATAAAMGVLTPMPCVPAIAGTWIPTVPTVTVGGMPILTSDCKAVCSFGGSISISAPGAAAKRLVQVADVNSAVSS